MFTGFEARILLNANVVRTFTHDGAGNITQDVRAGSGTYNYTMNQRNRLATARVGTTQVGSYVYDALERLAIRTTSNVSPAGTTHFAYDLSGKVLIEANGSNGATVREYVWFDDMPLAIVANVDTASPQLLHVHADHLDRPIMLTNASKANVWEAIYRPFGEVHAITGTATQNLRFPGQYFLFETGLAHNWHRTYDATIGRYLQADPLGFVDGPSVFSYVRSSPIALVDPLGQQAGSISRRPIWQPSPQSVPNICQQFPAVCGGWIPVAVQILKVCPGLIFEMAGGGRGGTDDGDDCKTKMTDWQIRELGLDAHEVKREAVGRKAAISRYELCICRDGSIVVRFKGCTGPVEPTGYSIR